MAEPKPYSDKEIKEKFATIADLKAKQTADKERFDGYIEDWADQKRKFQKRINELELTNNEWIAMVERQKKRIEELEKIVKDQCDPEDYDAMIIERDLQAATIERLRGALEPFALFTMSVTFKEKSKDRFVKAVFECKDFRTARQALGKE